MLKYSHSLHVIQCKDNLYNCHTVHIRWNNIWLLILNWLTGLFIFFRYHYPRMMRVFYVSLKVGQREFIGEGPTRQDARHDAAKKALHILRKLPVPNDGEKKIESPAESEGISSKDSILMGRHWEYTFELVQI